MPGPRIFLSYTAKDFGSADAIADALTQVGLDPWIDRREVKPGDSFVAAMERGLEESSYLLAIFSESSKASFWMPREWMSAAATRAIVVIPVLLDGASPPALLADIVHFRVDGPDRKGIGEITDFFRRELGKPGDALLDSHRFKDASASRRKILSISPRQLRLLAMRCLTEGRLKECCVDVEMDRTLLEGHSLHEKIVSFFHLAALDGRIPDIASWLEVDCGPCVKAGFAALEGTPRWIWPSQG